MTQIHRPSRHAKTPNSVTARVVLSLATMLFLVACGGAPPKPNTAKAPSNNVSIPLKRTSFVDQAQLDSLTPTELSTNFVDRVIHDLPVDAHLALFKELDPKALNQALNSQEKQLTFWINVYNGYTQYFLKTDPSLYISDRAEFFRKKQINIAGYQVSMEAIEHGVLRRGATIYTLGHFRHLWFRSEFVRTFAINKVDYRIHFALNCGAKSCPPVVAYTQAKVHQQLDANSAFYLQQEVQWQKEDNVIWVPALLLWFSADFSVDTSKYALLAKHGVLEAGKKPKLRYLPYDWSIEIENYKYYDLGEANSR